MPSSLKTTLDSPVRGSFVAETSMDSKQGKPRVWSMSVFVTVVTIALSGATYGLENSLMSPLAAMPDFVKKHQGINHETRNYTFTASHQSMIFSIPLIGTIFGALVSPYLQNRLGRKWSLCAAYMFSIPSTQLQLWAPNLAAFILGRVMNGLAYGCALSIGPLYLADVVPTSIRGGAVASSNLLTILANLMAAICCWATDKHYSDSRKYMVPLGVQAGLPFLLLLPTPFLPESPVWCVQKGRIGEARMALKRVRPVTDIEIEEELQEIVRTEQERRNMAKDTKFTDIFSRKHLLRTMVAGSFFALNQVSGIILSTTYATVFLTQLGLGDPFVLTVYAYLCQVAGATLAIVALEKVGRRALALPGFVVLTVIDMAAGGLAFYTGSPNAAKAISALAMVFNFFWTLCFYSISLLMPSELPTQRLRNYTMSYAIGCGQATAVVTTLALPQITASDAGNLAAKAYLIFGGCMFVITILAFFLLPETKGRTFFEIDQLYANRIPAWRWSKYEFCRATAVEEIHAVPVAHLEHHTHAVEMTSVDKKNSCQINVSESALIKRQN
ncbi:related to monosaccharide transporter [Melanopsichium pennsylvanicum]|uniref:Related to monosaccharide transporter n=2 Tax=Melanopsichium pennsylvanicum TaxID=63383 RepID=A0AAJ4XGJ7_9BASI|nr:related to monosaccharide transporter [Melanopsichium pennsylvanicum 4]SNX82070.1 related to monosaccharide transporter [Melanopsichium pennsylvanicum]